MFEFKISAISCGHCVRAVTEAVHALDPKAQVQIDIPTKRVEVTTQASRPAVIAALAEAGYAPADG
jgi:copper chaperone